MVSAVNNKPVSPVKKAAKVLTGTAITAGIIAAGLALGKKNDSFTKAGKIVSEKLGEGKGQQYVAQTVDLLNKAGKTVLDASDKYYGLAKDKVSSFHLKESTVYKEGVKLAHDAQGVVKQVVEQVKAADIPSKVSEYAKKISDAVKNAIK